MLPDETLQRQIPCKGWLNMLLQDEKLQRQQEAMGSLAKSQAGLQKRLQALEHKVHSVNNSVQYPQVRACFSNFDSGMLSPSRRLGACGAFSVAALRHEACTGLACLLCS